MARGQKEGGRVVGVLLYTVCTVCRYKDVYSGIANLPHSCV